MASTGLRLRLSLGGKRNSSDPHAARFIVFSSRVCHDYGEIRQNDRPCNKKPFGPAGDDYGRQYATGSDSHGNEIFLGAADLLIAQGAVGLCDGVDLRRHADSLRLDGHSCPLTERTTVRCCCD